MCQQCRFIVENAFNRGTIFTENSEEKNRCSDEWREYFIGHYRIYVEEQKGNEKNRAEIHKVCTIMKNIVSGVMKNNVDTFINFFL